MEGRYLKVWARTMRNSAISAVRSLRWCTQLSQAFRPLRLLPCLDSPLERTADKLDRALHAGAILRRCSARGTTEKL